MSTNKNNEKSALAPVSSPQEADDIEQSLADDSMSPPPVSGCFMFMCFAPSINNASKSKTKQKAKRPPRKVGSPESSVGSVNINESSVAGGGANSAQDKMPGSTDPSGLNLPNPNVSALSAPSNPDSTTAGKHFGWCSS
jgi:hypothetical protein